MSTSLVAIHTHEMAVMYLDWREILAMPAFQFNVVTQADWRDWSAEPPERLHATGYMWFIAPRSLRSITVFVPFLSLTRRVVNIFGSLLAGPIQLSIRHMSADDIPPYYSTKQSNELLPRIMT
jgi:hypothetical protein